MTRETFPLPGGQLEAVAVGRVLYVLPAILPTMPTRLRRLLELRREAAIRFLYRVPPPRPLPAVLRDSCAANDPG